MTDQQTRVNGLIARIEAHQAALGMKDDAFARRFQRYLRSPKSWTHRLRVRNWTEIGRALGKWEKNLNAFAVEIDTGTAGEDFYEQLPIYAYGAAVYELLTGARNDRRCAWLIAPTGVGKSFTMAKLHTEHLNESAYVQAVPSWKDSVARISTALAYAVGAEEKCGGAATFQSVLERLKEAPLTVMIDDIHEGGVTGMKLIKALIDQTKSRFILGSYPTGYFSLVNASTSAMSEAQQLFGRSLKPISEEWVKGVRPADVAAFLHAATGLRGEAVSVAAGTLVEPLRRGGNFRALADAIEMAAGNADEAGEDLTLDLVRAAVLQLCPARGERKAVAP
jgi:hypothetical protein